MLHVLPNNKIPVDKLPLDQWISNALGYQRKQERSGPAATRHGSMTKREETLMVAAQSGLFLIPEFQFEHCIYSIPTDAIGADPGSFIMDVYRRCSDFLRLATKPDTGLTVLVSPRWLFVTVLTNPYTKTGQGFPVYLDGLAFTGLVSLQSIE